MLTPQEVSTHAFSKAMMGGYNMSAVDEFLDVLTDDYTALYKENAALKAKLKVLVEKVEEYRATEDSMRATLLTAQRMADTMVREAETKRDQMLAEVQAKRDALLAEAETDARQKLSAYRQELSAEQARLEQGRQELARFIAASRELCLKELSMLEQLPQAEVSVPVEEPEQTPEPRVEEIEEQVLAAFAAETPAEPETVKAAPAEAAEEPAPAEAADDYPEGNPFEDSLDSTRRIDLSDLKFGRNYTGEN